MGKNHLVWMGKIICLGLLLSFFPMNAKAATEEGKTEEADSVEYAEHHSDDKMVQEGTSLEVSSQRQLLRMTYGIPYLFPEKNGYLNPDGLMSEEDINNALGLLFEGGVENPERRLSHLHMTLNEAKKLTKREFASRVEEIRGYTNAWVQVEDYPVICLDVDYESEKDASLVRGTVAYHLDSNGKSFLNALLAAKWIPGYYWTKGYLYLADEEGFVLRNQHLGDHLYFNENGRFTSGDAAVDFASAERLFGVMQENVGATRYELLRACFFDITNKNDYMHSRFAPGFGDNCNNRWYLDRALNGLENYIGDCFEYSAAFCALARNLGYDAHCISGFAFREEGYHSYTSIRLTPEEMVWREETNELIADSVTNQINSDRIEMADTEEIQTAEDSMTTVEVSGEELSTYIHDTQHYWRLVVNQKMISDYTFLCGMTSYRAWKETYN